jgi:hypothetical protein
MNYRFVGTAMMLGVLTAVVPRAVLGGEMPKSGSTSYTTHYVFNPTGYDEVKGVGKITPLLLVGNTTNDKGEAAFDKMKARCFAIKVEAGAKSYFDGSCSLTDEDGDAVFSTFDSRQLDKSQPEMNCGTHAIIGGTGKYQGITGTEAFACHFVKETPPGQPFADYRVDFPHNVTWEIK